MRIPPERDAPQHQDYDEKGEQKADAMFVDHRL
jgi:hypothetical protein